MAGDGGREERGTMKMGSMFADALRSLFRRPVTERYPYQRETSPERLRGKLHWDPQRCTGCALCVKDCPANALELIVLDKQQKRFVLRYQLDRCTFCAQCVQSCRFNCLELANDEWELAETSRNLFTYDYGAPEDVEAVLEGRVAAEAETAPES